MVRGHVGPGHRRGLTAQECGALALCLLPKQRHPPEWTVPGGRAGRAGRAGSTLGLSPAAPAEPHTRHCPAPRARGRRSALQLWEAHPGDTPKAGPASLETRKPRPREVDSLSRPRGSPPSTAQRVALPARACQRRTMPDPGRRGGAEGLSQRPRPGRHPPRVAVRPTGSRKGPGTSSRAHRQLAEATAQSVPRL